MTRSRLFRMAERPAPAAENQHAATAAAIAVAGGAGRPLSGAQQRQAGHWFGTDLTDVRVHDDGAARDAAESIGARAYTVGKHIVFGAGGLAGGGNRLLAHELAHVVQNRSVPQASAASRLSSPEDPAERAADAVADRIEAGRGAAGLATARPAVARAVAAEGGQAAAEPATAAPDEAPAAAAPDEAWDGDAPVGGPILAVAGSPDELDPEPAAGDHPLPSDTQQLADNPQPADPQQSAGSPAVLASAAVQRKAKQPAAPPPTNRTQLPIPASARRWITRIDIRLAVPQSITVHWSDRSPDQSASASSGRGRPCTSSPPCPGNNGLNCTPSGTFHPTFRGDANYVNGHGDHMSYYVDLGVQDAQGNDRGIGIHDSQPVTGRPASHGCIRVPQWMARLVNGNVIRTTDVIISGVAPAVAYRDSSCPAPPPSRTRPRGGAPVHRSRSDSPSGPLAELAVPAGPAPIRLSRLDVGNGRTVSDAPGPAANTREDVLQVMDRMHLLWLLTNADYAAEQPAVAQQPPGSEVATSRIRLLNGAIDRMPAVDTIPAPVAGALYGGLSVAGGIGPGQPNRRADVLALIHAMHAAWDLHEAPPLAFADALAELGTADPVDAGRLVVTRQAIRASYGRYVRGFPGAGAPQAALPPIPVPGAGAPPAGTRSAGGGGLSWELTDAPAGPTPRARVGSWLGRYSGVIGAAETRHGVDRRAIAAAIAWEALHNVAGGTTLRQWSGPGKVHNTAYIGTPASQQVESLGYLPAQTEAARSALLSDPVGAISYIGAIMQGSADAADTGGYNLRADPPMLCFLYHSWDIERSRRHFATKRSPAPLDHSSSAMAVWIEDATNLAFVTAAVGSPSGALAARPRGY
ncbi:eCIS core domain-containing protein [Jatrophihabitans sp.]|uniref:eCIS core domain-containing protein n=1 Tax=Jatrophihabitans sp. TaxID=1932789 RepID=UPI002C6F4EFF|nr:DUF4157 domain-containing protein [Jatrophihabitans sp.]